MNAASTVLLSVRVPAALREQAEALARQSGETVSDIVREALAGYVQAKVEDDDAAFARAELHRVAQGAPTYSHEEVWAEIERLEAAGELPA